MHTSTPVDAVATETSYITRGIQAYALGRPDVRFELVVDGRATLRTMGDGVWLASHVLVLGPVKIGEHSVVAGGSLVREDIEPYTVVAGRPAKVVKKIVPPSA